MAKGLKTDDPSELTPRNKQAAAIVAVSEQSVYHVSQPRSGSGSKGRRVALKIKEGREISSKTRAVQPAIATGS